MYYEFKAFYIFFIQYPNNFFVTKKEAENILLNKKYDLCDHGVLKIIVKYRTK